LLAVVKILPSLLFIMLLSGIVDGSITTNKMADNAVTAAGTSEDVQHIVLKAAGQRIRLLWMA